MSCHRLYHLPVAWAEGLDLESIKYLLRDGHIFFIMVFLLPLPLLPLLLLVWKDKNKIPWESLPLLWVYLILSWNRLATSTSCQVRSVPLHLLAYRIMLFSASSSSCWGGRGPSLKKAILSISYLSILICCLFLAFLCACVVSSVDLPSFWLLEHVI